MTTYREQLRGLGYTQRSAADALGVSLSTVRRWCGAPAAPRLAVLALNALRASRIAQLTALAEREAST